MLIMRHLQEATDLLGPLSLRLQREGNSSTHGCKRLLCSGSPFPTLLVASARPSLPTPSACPKSSQKEACKRRGFPVPQGSPQPAEGRQGSVEGTFLHVVQVHGFQGLLHG